MRVQPLAAQSGLTAAYSCRGKLPVGLRPCEWSLAFGSGDLRSLQPTSTSLRVQVRDDLPHKTSERVSVFASSMSSTLAFPSVPIEREMTLIGKRGLLVAHFDEAKFNQGHQIVLADGRQFCSFGFDIAQRPAQTYRSIEI